MSHLSVPRLKDLVFCAYGCYCPHNPRFTSRAAMTLSLSFTDRIDACLGHKHVRAVHFQHHKSLLVQGHQAPPLGLQAHDLTTYERFQAAVRRDTGCPF